MRPLPSWSAVAVSNLSNTTFLKIWRRRRRSCFWWRINAWTEIAGIVFSFLVAVYFQVVHPALGFEPLADATRLLLAVGLTAAGWRVVTLLTAPTNKATLRNFYRTVRPTGPGWRPVVQQLQSGAEPLPPAMRGELPVEILCMVVGTFTVYFALFASGYWIYGQTTVAIVLTALAVVGSLLLFRLWGRLKESVAGDEKQAWDGAMVQS